MSNNNNNNDDDNSDNDNKTPTSYSPNVDYDYIDKIYAAENEAERRTIALNNVYELARKKIRAAGGMMTQQDAMKEILREEKESYARGIEELAAFDPANYEEFKYRLPTFEEMQARIDLFDQALAD